MYINGLNRNHHKDFGVINPHGDAKLQVWDLSICPNAEALRLLRSRAQLYVVSGNVCRWRSLTFTSANRLGYLPMAILKFHQRWRWNIPSWRLHGWCTVHSSPDRCGWMVTQMFLEFIWIYDGNFVFSCIMSTCERLSPLCRVLSFCIFNQFVLLSNLGHCPPWRQPNLQVPNSWGLKLALLWQRWIWHDSSDL